MRSSSPAKHASARLKAVPWAVLAQVSVVIGKRWTALSSNDRARLTALVRESRGRRGNLSSKQRNDLRKLVGKLDLTGAGRELLPLVRGGKRSRKRG